MLIVPTGHWQEISQPRRMSRRERWIVGGGIGLLAVIAVVVAVSLTSTQRSSGHGCIDVSAATAIGGSELYRCGSAARELCTQPTTGGSQDVAFQRALAHACRRLIHMSRHAP